MTRIRRGENLGYKQRPKSGAIGRSKEACLKRKKKKKKKEVRKGERRGRGRKRERGKPPAISGPRFPVRTRWWKEAVLLIKAAKT